MPTTVPCLWCDLGDAGPAARYYVEIFPDSSVTGVTRYGPGTPGPEGEVMTVDFVLDGRPWLAPAGGPQFPFTEAVSFQVHCVYQAETDHYWTRLGEGGEEGRCGWLKDRFGVSGQVVPTELLALTTDPDPGRRHRATQAMLRMGRIDLAELRRAADGR